MLRLLLLAFALHATVAYAASDTVARLAASIEGGSLDLVLAADGAETRATLDLSRQGDLLRLRIDVVDGRKAGTRVLGQVPAEGTPRFWVRRPELGVDPVRMAQVESQFQELGASLEDLLLLLQPGRAGALEAWSERVEGTSLVVEGPPRADGCRDTWTLPSRTAELPSSARLCPRGSLGARTVTFQGRTTLGARAVPAVLEIRTDEGTSRVLLSAPEPERWRAETRYDRDALGS